MQTKAQSIKETITDVITGYIISVAITFIINYFHDIEIATWKNFSMTACYTVVSMIRKYIRRYFNNKEQWVYSFSKAYDCHCWTNVKKGETHTFHASFYDKHESWKLIEKKQNEDEYNKRIYSEKNKRAVGVY